MKAYYGYFSECGPRRNNEDYIAVREMPEQGRSVYVLCDGMGGHCLGEVASKLVADHICGYWEKNPKRHDSPKKVLDACAETMVAFNAKSKVEMGTTMTMVAIEGNKALLAHCGDSRIYVARDHEIIYRSEDHVGVSPEGWPVVKKAFFTGRDEISVPFIKEMEIQEGDMILLCSDGVFGNDKEAKAEEALLFQYGYPLSQIEKVAADRPHDNYSAILIRICEDDPDPSEQNLFKMHRHLKGDESQSEVFEYFRKRRDAMNRLCEYYYGPDKDKYRYGVTRLKTSSRPSGDADSSSPDTDDSVDTGEEI